MSNFRPRTIAAAARLLPEAGKRAAAGFREAGGCACHWRCRDRRPGLRTVWQRLLLVAIAAWCASPVWAAPADAPPRKIVLLAGTVHQGAGGHPPGTHEYELTARLLKQAIDAAGLPGVRVEVHFDGWPRDEATLNDADTIAVISDGADRNTLDHPLLVGDRLSAVERQMRRGCGLVAIHWSVFVPNDRGGPQFLEWIGGYFDYQSGEPPRGWYSKIETAATTPSPATPEHPICRGLAPFDLREEYYYNLRFRPDDARRVPILTTTLPGEPRAQVVAWAVERGDGGRGFGFTGGHFFENWGVENFRRLVVNAVLWTAHVEVPPGGTSTAAPASLEPVGPGDDEIQALIVTGHQHPAHDWRATTAALQEALAQDRRIQLTVVTDPEFLAADQLQGYDVVLLNYCNWQRAGLSDAAQAAFQRYLADGGGLAIVHFSNGAFHASLAETPPSDWPEFRNICRRVWDHAPGKSSHDAYGRFTVRVVRDHPITSGLSSFETIDELYCNQQGDAPIEVLATARSTVSGRDEPMAFVYGYGRGRVFQTVLGHDAASIRVPGTAELMRRGTVWAADRPQRRATVPSEPAPAAPPRLAPEGKFGAALDPRGQAALAPRQPAYAGRPLSVECFTKLASKSGFNVLAASGPKESADHWEIYSYAGSGCFSLYLPGCEPAEIVSGVDITDDRWHHVAAAFDESRARLYVDGKLVKETPLARRRGDGPNGPLAIGGYPPGNIGCDGLIDELRISSGLRAFDQAPAAPLAADEQTVGLWHFDRLENGRVEDVSKLRNAAACGTRPVASFPLLARRPADARHKLTSICTSPDESYLSLRNDTSGRLFLGGREGLFVCEPDAAGCYAAPRLLYRFPPDTWVTDIEIRGDDLYVMTNAALYRAVGGRVAREPVTPERLLWGSPVDLHVTWHGLAWGPEGDLYFSSGDPLLNHGDFQNRPDHWGHWTLYSQADGGRVPYTGVGGFFRCRPDGSGLRLVAGGARGAVGLAFDRRWNLFSNDNDHESLAHRYSPARLLHVAPHAQYFWPRGWIAGLAPERSDLLDIVNDTLGREVPVGQAYYDEPLLGECRDNLLVALWGQRRIDRFVLTPRGASFRAEKAPLLVGDELARPVGVAVGRDGRVFAAISYMAGNEWSPKYPSEVVMIAPAEGAAPAFAPYELPKLAPARLWSDLSHASWQRRRDAQLEILRRGEPLLSEAAARLKSAAADDRALVHLVWLAAASKQPAAVAALVPLAAHRNAAVRQQAVRALAEFCDAQTSGELFTRALGDVDPQVQHAAVAAWFDRPEPLPAELFAGPARSDDLLLRQAAALLVARRGTTAQLDALVASPDAPGRLAGVLACGFRLSVPPPHDPLPAELPLAYDSTNAEFVVQYADARIDLRALGRVGSFTTAQRWKALRPTVDEQHACQALEARLDDADNRVHAQAAYFLSLLDDAAANVRIAATRRARTLAALAGARSLELRDAWLIGPFDDGVSGFAAAHPPQQAAIDLAAPVSSAGKDLSWRRIELAAPRALAAAAGPASSYVFFRVQSRRSQHTAIEPAGLKAFQLWHNGRAIAESDPPLVALEPGSNDLLLRVAHGDVASPLAVSVRAVDGFELELPEPVGESALADRLRGASSDGAAAVPAEFLTVDWSEAARRGDAERGRRLFGEALGCAKCHAILPNQPGGGGPSLADAGRRFTVSHLVESVLAPSRQVAAVFGTTVVLTDDGRALSGLVVEEDERRLVLLLPTAARLEVAKRAIADRKLQSVSPMPGGLVKTPAELGDLLAYLLSAEPRAP